MVNEMKKWMFLMIWCVGCSGTTTQTPPQPLVDLQQPQAKISTTPHRPTGFASPFSFSTELVSTGLVQRVRIDHNVGTMTINGTQYPAAVYDQQIVGQYTMYHTMVSAPDQWFMSWIYCVGDRLDGIYIESTAGQPMTWQPVINATCNVELRDTIAEVALPAPNITVATEPTGYDIQAKAFEITPDGEGFFEHLGRRYDVRVFETVVGDTGWTGFHSVISDEELTCFGIFYIVDGATSPLQLGYSRCLPPFSNPFGYQSYTGTWTKSP